MAGRSTHIFWCTCPSPNLELPLPRGEYPRSPPSSPTTVLRQTAGRLPQSNEHPVGNGKFDVTSKRLFSLTRSERANRRVNHSVPNRFRPLRAGLFGPDRLTNNGFISSSAAGEQLSVHVKIGLHNSGGVQHQNSDTERSTVAVIDAQALGGIRQGSGIFGHTVPEPRV